MAQRLALLFGLSIALFLLMTQVAFAQANGSTPDIISIKHSILTVQELERQGILTHADAEKSIIYYVAQASQAAGHPLTLDEILATPDPAPQKLTPLQQFAGAIDFLTLLLVLAVLAVGGAVIYLFRYYVAKLLQLFKNVPVIVYEIVFYTASLGCALWGWFLPEPIHSSLGFLGCLFFTGALGFSSSYHRVPVNQFRFSVMLFIVWAVVAFLFGSSLIGFIAVGALLSAFGFSPFLDLVFNDGRHWNDHLFERSTLAAFAVLSLFIGLRLTGTLLPALAVFEFGALFLGSLVGYAGLLYLSTRLPWNYALRHRKRYWGFQAVTIIAGVGALFFGSVFQISELRKIGGTFFVLYCLVKLLEIPTRSRPAFARLIAIVGIIVIACCWFALTHQELFRQWLFLPG
ncbi:MAG TPA: hypothetical protein VFB60_18925 [Ktedonobacteraceae bacterium]|nr:hypothetical protein [Ktedonobacteraceae bacterium]